MEKPKDDTPLPTEIKFDYIKSSLFRVVHADGVFGGPTPQQFISMSFFSERLAIPRQTTQAVGPDAQLGKEIIEKRVVRDAIIRELEICVMLTPQIAIKLHEWLGNHIEQIKQFPIDANEVK